MKPERYFVDTSFFLALLNKNDSLHDKAEGLLPLIKSAKEVFLHEAILVELANSMCENEWTRSIAVKLIDQSYKDSNTKVINVSTELMRNGFEIYRVRSDKKWSLTDCISIVVMNENKLSKAVTGDHHFEQAGFEKLLETS